MDSYILKNKEKDKWICCICLSIILILATGYVYCHAVDAWYSDIFLLLLVFVSIPCLLSGDGDFVEINKKFVYCWFGYLGFALASVLYPPGSLADDGRLLKAFSLLGGVTIVALAFWAQRRVLKDLTRWLLPLLCLSLCVFLLLSSYRVFDKDIFELILPWEVHAGNWQNKVFCFFLVFLMWGAVATLWRKSVVETLIAAGLVVVSLWALLSYNSESSQLAFGVGVLVFGLTHLPLKKYRYSILLLTCSLFLLIPLLWTFFAPLLEDPSAIYHDSTSFLGQYEAVRVRVFLYDFCADIARGGIWLGHGFGSSPHITMPEGIVPPYSGGLLGGHPHNIIFLFLLEQGIIGFLWLAGMFFVLFDYLYHATVDRDEGPATFALLVSGQVVFSLSFAIWIPDVVLIYGMFFVILLITSSLSGHDQTGILRERVFNGVQYLVLLSFVCHFVNEYFLSVT